MADVGIEVVATVVVVDVVGDVVVVVLFGDVEVVVGDVEVVVADNSLLHQGREQLAERRNNSKIAKVAISRRIIALTCYGPRDGYIRCLEPTRRGAKSTPAPLARPPTRHTW